VIPKGAIIITNLYEMGRDHRLYPDGDRFDPSRFIDEHGHIKQPERDSKDDYLCFGHGRRVCVGKALAINSLWITFAYLLWAFDFEKGFDANGDEICPTEPGFHDKGATLDPVAFPVRFIPRFPDLRDRIKAVGSKD